MGAVTLFTLNGVVAARATTLSWSPTASPEPVGATQSAFYDVSCPIPTRCIAVGEYSHGTTKGLLERWDGHDWAVMHPRNPVGFIYSTLRGVACPTTTSCFAVGAFAYPNQYHPLIEHWDGTAWAIMPIPDQHIGDYDDRLNDVACPSPTSCFAVGNFGNPGKLIEHWNGTRWSGMTDDSVAPSAFAGLDGVACPSTTNCVAVGNYGTCPFVEHWPGHGSWKRMTGTPCTDGTEGLLRGVTCASNTACFAVGSNDSDPLIMRWNGRGTWTLLRTPDAGGARQLFAVTCVSPASCVAVGTHTVGNDPEGRALVEQWNGTGWTLGMPPGAPIHSGLFGVTCTSGNTCQAVGSRVRDSAYRVHTQVDESS